MKPKMTMLSVMLMLALLAAPPVMGQDQKAAPPGNGSDSLFAAPVLLKAGDKPMGGDLIYPSPMMFDRDGDKRLEMYVGDLRGMMWVAEKLPGGPANWTELKPLNKADGKQLKFHNW